MFEFSVPVHTFTFQFFDSFIDFVFDCFTNFTVMFWWRTESVQNENKAEIQIARPLRKVRNRKWVKSGTYFGYLCCWFCALDRIPLYENPDVSLGFNRVKGSICIFLTWVQNIVVALLLLQFAPFSWGKLFSICQTGWLRAHIKWSKSLLKAKPKKKFTYITILPV